MTGTPHITELQFDGFKSLRQLRLPLHSRFVILVGGNASGKTSVLQATELLCATMQWNNPAQSYGPGFELFKAELDWAAIAARHGGGGNGIVTIGATTASSTYELRAREDRFSRVATRLACTPIDGGEALIADYGVEVDLTNEKNSTFWGRSEPRNLGGAARLMLSASAARAPSLPNDRVPRIDHDGSGLASVLNWLSANEPSAKEAIEDALRKVVPGARAIRTPNEQVRTRRAVRVDSSMTFVEDVAWGHAIEVEFQGVGFLPAASLSEGTLLTLTLLTYLHGADKPRTLLLDDIERALHPAAQFKLVALLRAHLEAHPDLQIVASTHSPFILDDFSGNEVILLAADDAGVTRCRMLSDHPDHERFKESLRPGEFWSTVGEQWVLGVP
jgi:predicted ATPase